jgi:hypothetical protein
MAPKEEGKGELASTSAPISQPPQNPVGSHLNLKFSSHAVFATQFWCAHIHRILGDGPWAIFICPNGNDFPFSAVWIRNKIIESRIEHFSSISLLIYRLVAFGVSVRELGGESWCPDALWYGRESPECLSSIRGLRNGLALSLFLRPEISFCSLCSRLVLLGLWSKIDVPSLFSLFAELYLDPSSRYQLETMWTMTPKHLPFLFRISLSSRLGCGLIASPIGKDHDTGGRMTDVFTILPHQPFYPRPSKFRTHNDSLVTHL